MKIIISGVNGQLGKAIINSKRNNYEVIGLNKTQFDLENFKSCEDLILSIKPDWIINTAAYTQVDKAEHQKEKAYKVNSYGIENIAKVLSSYGGKLIHISTDFVFGGDISKSYLTTDICKPLGVYGASKLKGEELSLKFPNVVIIRTSWLYGPVGANFCLTMLKLHKKFSEENKSLRVISDQIGCPTSTSDLAGICWEFIEKLKNKEFSSEVYHWSSSGVTSWYDFAIAIGELGEKFRLIKKPAKVIPISSEQYKTDAKRPNFSILNCKKTIKKLNIEQTYWRSSLNEVIQKISHKDF